MKIYIHVLYGCHVVLRVVIWYEMLELSHHFAVYTQVMKESYCVFFFLLQTHVDAITNRYLTTKDLTEKFCYVSQRRLRCRWLRTCLRVNTSTTMASPPQPPRPHAAAPWQATALLPLSQRQQALRKYLPSEYFLSMVYTGSLLTFNWCYMLISILYALLFLYK